MLHHIPRLRESDKFHPSTKGETISMVNNHACNKFTTTSPFLKCVSIH